MPNWVNNTLTIDDKYLNKVINADNKVDFGLIVPMPKDLEIEDSSRKETAIYYYMSHRDNLYFDAVVTDPDFKKVCDVYSRYAILDKNANEKTIAKDMQERMNKWSNRISGRDNEQTERDEVYELGKRLVYNAVHYNAMTWYDWCNDNWGCKWNASYTEIESLNNNQSIVRFNTPWYTPVNYLHTLCEQFHVPFQLHWFEEQGFQGEITSDGNTITEKDLPFQSPYDDDE